MSRVVYPARETVTEIRGEDAAEIINKMMEKEGMTQIQLAQKMGITRQRVSRLISGNMRYENFVRIVNAAGYDVKIEKRNCEKKLEIIEQNY